MVVHAKHGSLQRIAAIAFADRRIGGSFDHFKVSAEVLLDDGFQVHRLITDKPQAVAWAAGARRARWRDIHVVNHLTCFDVYLFQGGYVVCSGV